MATLSDRPGPVGLAAAAAGLGSGPATIAYLGNSVTAQQQGYRSPLHAGLCARFGHAHRAVNAGFGGVGSLASLGTMDDLVIAHRPQLCFIECLTGDIGVGLHRDTGAALEGMLTKLAAIGCAACFLQLPRAAKNDASEDSADIHRATVQAIVETYDRVARHYAVAVIDARARFSDAGPWFFRDTVHVTEAGGAATASFILGMLEPLWSIDPGVARPGRCHDRDLSGATTIGLDPAWFERPPIEQGRFRLVRAYAVLAAGNIVRPDLPRHDLIGLLVVVGPDSARIRIGSDVHELRDRWSHYERLHALILDQAVPTGAPVAIEVLARADGPATLKLVGLLVRPVPLSAPWRSALPPGPAPRV